ATTGFRLAEDGPFVDLELVAGEMVGLEGRGALEDAAPGIGRLAGEAVDQVDRDGGEAGFSRESYGPLGFGGRVAAAEEGELLVVEALDSEAQGREALTAPGNEPFGVDVLGIRFEEEAGVRRDSQAGAEELEQAGEAFGLEDRGGAAAEVDGV